jgi:hypothetical protein
MTLAAYLLMNPCSMRTMGQHWPQNYPPLEMVWTTRFVYLQNHHPTDKVVHQHYHNKHASGAMIATHHIIVVITHSCCTNTEALFSQTSSGETNNNKTKLRKKLTLVCGRTDSGDPALIGVYNRIKLTK